MFWSWVLPKIKVLKLSLAKFLYRLKLSLWEGYLFLLDQDSWGYAAISWERGCSTDLAKSFSDSSKSARKSSETQLRGTGRKVPSVDFTGVLLSFQNKHQEDTCHSKQKHSVGTGCIKLTLPLLSSQAGQDYTGSYNATLRSRRKTLPKAGGILGSSQPSSYVGKLSSGDSGYERDRKGHLPTLNVKDQNTIADRDMTTLKDSITKQLCISAESVEGEEADTREDQEKEPTKEETRAAGSKGTTSKLMNLPGKQRPSHEHETLIMDTEAYAADGCLRTMYTRPNFLKSYTEARKALYIRHKSTPAWEKELSLQEIFGHKKTMEHSPQEQALIKP
ncbi:coiled-coil domain-containing protein 190 isoform X1 [Rhineura floridana]|uniref:coiled-coil domain-containing protein 190 isoform X1 n=1 Tax=Rhineura floridana TaxID=261503 RepID=UPI002AC81789|nr:coiled-coil domain-containing protein 190 isoform X1 [Rhineura floridana]